MKRRLSVLSVLLLITLVVYLADLRFPDSPGTVKLNGFYKVMQVHDGDTIAILLDGKRVTVRLIGIDSPEVNTPYTKAERFGKEASAAAHQLFDNAIVRIETDPSQQMYDIYDRLLAYVFVPTEAAPGGVLANKYFVEQGYAREYTYKDPYAYRDAFVSAEALARDRRMGLWSACTP